jgi:hypothetical protein
MSNVKQYIVNVKRRKRTSIWIEYSQVDKAFPVILEAKNKEQVREMAESIIRDLGTYPEGFIIQIDIGS